MRSGVYRSGARGLGLACTLALFLGALGFVPAAGTPGWSYTDAPAGRGTEIFTAVLHDVPQAFVTVIPGRDDPSLRGASVWRFGVGQGWTKILDGTHGDPSLHAVVDRLYVNEGYPGENDNIPAEERDRRPFRISGPGSDAPLVARVDWGPTRCGHESLFAFDSSGEGRWEGGCTGLPIEFGSEYGAPDDLVVARSYPKRIGGSAGQDLPLREHCRWPSPAPTATPGIFAHGCINSAFSPAVYEFVREGENGDTRVPVAIGVRSFPGGRDLLVDRGDGVPYTGSGTTAARVAKIFAYPRPSLAYNPSTDTYVAMVGRSDSFGPGGIHWYLFTDIYYSVDGGSSWLFGGRLCGDEGADCYAGSVVYDDAANRFWFTWLQRRTGFGQYHDVLAGYLPGDLDASAGQLGVTREIVDHVNWSGLNGIDVWANGQIAFDDFVAVGYAKNDKVTYAYKQF